MIQHDNTCFSFLWLHGMDHFFGTYDYIFRINSCRDLIALFVFRVRKLRVEKNITQKHNPALALNQNLILRYWGIFTTQLEDIQKNTKNAKFWG